jgi:HSP20 family protein
MQKTNGATLPQTRDPFQSLFQRLFGDALPELYGGGSDGGTGSIPRTNISETGTAYQLAFELPGVDEKDINVDLQEQMLTVTAERKDERTDKGDARWHRVEHRYGRFTRTISLPHDASPDGIEAVYQKGVLHVKVPKAPEARPRRIEVRGA